MNFSIYDPRNRQLDPYDTPGSGAVTGAGTGAAVGTEILPGLGTLGGAVIGAGAGALYGKSQLDKANKLKNTGYIPPAEIENKRLAGLNYSSTYYPGQGTEEARGKQVIANSIGNLQRNAKSATDVLNGASNIEAGVGTNVANQIAGRYAQWKQKNLATLMGVNSQIAGFEDRNNQQFLAQKAALIGAGTQNIARSTNDLLTAAGSAYDVYKRNGNKSTNQRNSSPFTYPDYEWGAGTDNAQTDDVNL